MCRAASSPSKLNVETVVVAERVPLTGWLAASRAGLSTTPLPRSSRPLPKGRLMFIFSPTNISGGNNLAAMADALAAAGNVGHVHEPVDVHVWQRSHDLAHRVDGDARRSDTARPNSRW